jgi:hypothetical protein
MSTQTLRMEVTQERVHRADERRLVLALLEECTDPILEAALLRALREIDEGDA